MMITVRNYPKNLFKLVDAVRRHNPRILIQKIRQPAQNTEQKTVQGKMPDSRFLFSAIKQFLQGLFVAAVGKQQQKKFVKADKKAHEN